MTPKDSLYDENIKTDKASNAALDLAASLSAALGAAGAFPLRQEDKPLLEGLDTFRFGPHDSRKAWSVGEGPLVILVHGYSGRGVQMALLAKTIAAKGFRCVFFDAGGHGESKPEKIGFFTFMNDTRDIISYLEEPIYGLVGHSAGGLAMMRARSIYGYGASKYCIINAPFFPYVPLETMRQSGAPEAAVEYIKAILSDQFQMSWSSLVSGKSYIPETEDASLLAVYDMADKKVHHTDAEAIDKLWPAAKIVKTNGYGHNRILQAKETLEAVTAFLVGG